MVDKMNYGDHVRLKALDFSLETSRSLIFASITILAGVLVFLGEKAMPAPQWAIWLVVGFFLASTLMAFVDIVVSYMRANEGKSDSQKKLFIFIKLLPTMFFILGCGQSIFTIWVAYAAHAPQIQV